MTQARAPWTLMAAATLVAVLGLLGAAEDARLFVLDGPRGRVQWSAGLPLGTRFVGNPVALSGQVVVGTAGPAWLGGGDDRWQISAYDTRSGRRLWTYRPPAEQARRLEATTMALTTPFITEQHVFVRQETSDSATLLALDVATGLPTWTVEHLAFGHSSRHTDVVALGGRVLVPVRVREGGRDDPRLTLRALREGDGSELWRVDLGPADFPQNDIGPFFAASPDTFYVGLGSGVVALDAVTGAERWRTAEPPGDNGGPIERYDNLLYRRTSLQTITAYDAATGVERWTYRPAFSEWRGALRSLRVRDMLLTANCACASDGRTSWVLGVDAKTGVERWRAPADASFDLNQDRPAIGGGVAVTGQDGGEVVARTMMEGAERWRFPRERGQLVTSDDRLIYLTDRAPSWRHWLALAGLPAPR